MPLVKRTKSTTHIIIPMSSGQGWAVSGYPSQQSSNATAHPTNHAESVVRDTAVSTAVSSNAMMRPRRRSGQADFRRYTKSKPSKFSEAYLYAPAAAQFSPLPTAPGTPALAAPPSRPDRRRRRTLLPAPPPPPPAPPCHRTTASRPAPAIVAVSPSPTPNDEPIRRTERREAESAQDAPSSFVNSGTIWNPPRGYDAI